MDFQFDPTFSLLPKFSIGLRPMPTSEEEMKLVSTYLGVELPAAELQENAQRLSNELESQNGFLTKNLESNSIYESDKYRRSMFIRDIVANNRFGCQRHPASNR